ncbi:nuclear transport factor 2 family protein [Sphingobium sp. SCG-1]|uniref:nuclear transport factor 2 family protein n=1 Tax=Sphingobium sp. SCG-1 TaxID=2072936 RepID=UPI00167026D9|nr:nuclear transport factor 2 family protein [Sphingobium sp. SCG-1]
MSEAVVQAIQELEKRRCAALVSGDVDALDAMLIDDLVHVHGTGKFDTKSEYLEGIRSKYTFHKVERGELNIRVYGDVVVVVGPLSQSVQVAGGENIVNITAIVSQTWNRVGDSWKQSTCHTGFLSKS